jgi:hypothetical protein
VRRELRSSAGICQYAHNKGKGLDENTDLLSSAGCGQYAHNNQDKGLDKNAEYWLYQVVANMHITIMVRAWMRIRIYWLHQDVAIMHKTIRRRDG